MSVEYKLDGNVAIVTLNRPDKLNAMSDEMYSRMTEGYRKFKRPFCIICTVSILAQPVKFAFCTSASAAPAYVSSLSVHQFAQAQQSHVNPMV